MDRKCLKCGKVKDVSSFKKAGWHKDKQKYRGECRECTKIIKKSWKKNNPKIRARAISAVGRAIQGNVLFRMPCEVCNDFEVEAHHDNYNKPLKVRWLCRSHHQKFHKPKRIKIININASKSQRQRYIDNPRQRNAVGQFAEEGA